MISSAPLTPTGRNAVSETNSIFRLPSTKQSMAESHGPKTRRQLSQLSPPTNSRSVWKETISQRKSRCQRVDARLWLIGSRYDVFLQYQMQIHKDPKSRWGQSAFKRFLCTGLDRKIIKIGGKTLRLGSYHQCYYLDSKLVAVGVLDLLPHAVSSVYLL